MGTPFQTALQTTTEQSTFDTLLLGKTSQTLRARLLRFWPSETFPSCRPFRGTTLTFVDCMGSMINGLLPAPQEASFFTLLEENTVYNFSNFEVAKCPTMYKTTEHPYVIRFLEQTILEPVEDSSSDIPSQKFMVRTYDQLHMLADTNLELPDVFGIIKLVKSYGLNSAGVIAPVLLRLHIPGEAEVELALLDNAASVFRRLLSSPEKMRRAMLSTSLNPKRIGGSLCLLSTIGTRFYFADELPPLTHITKTLVSSQMHNLSQLDVGATVNASQVSTIGDLNAFLTNTEGKEPLLGCKARIVDIIYPDCWFTFGCSECEQPLHCSSSHQACTHTRPRCIVRYQVEMLVDDGQNYVVFSVGAKDILGLIKHKAPSLATHEVLKTHGSIPPPALEQLRGGVYVFHVLTTPIFTSQSGPFSVVGISEVAENSSGIALVQIPAEEGT